MDNKIHTIDAASLQDNDEPLTGTIQLGDTKQDPKGQHEGNTDRVVCDVRENALVDDKTDEVV